MVCYGSFWSNYDFCIQKVLRGSKYDFEKETSNESFNMIFGVYVYADSDILYRS